MENPWQKLHEQCLSESACVLDIDRECIRRFNESVRDEAKKVRVASIPEPFIGSPESARVVLLGLNPSHSEQDEKDYRNAAFRQSMFRNLRHEPQEYPFYPLNPAFEGTGAGAWWRKHTRKVQDDSGLDTATFAKRLLVIEWFPYHSKSSALPPRLICESQKYSFQLATRMLNTKGVPIVGMRSRAHWMTAEQRFGEVPLLTNRRRSYITRGNMEESLYDRIVEALQRNG